MATTTNTHRTAGYKPGLAAFSAVAAAWVFVLVALGAFTTSIGAGMAFPDWPLSNGSLNPTGWLTNLAMFAEHSHRLSAGLMTILTGILAFWIWRTEERQWLRRLSYFAAGLVVAQGVVGGLRVRLDPVQVAAVDTSLGRLFAMLHACLAQAFACVADRYRGLLLAKAGSPGPATVGGRVERAERRVLQGASSSCSSRSPR
jgi:cytochrome c oxidase assembly protein subunit 15